MGLSGAKEYLFGLNCGAPLLRRKARQVNAKSGLRAKTRQKKGLDRAGLFRAVLGMRERPLTNRKGRKSARFQAPPIPRNPVGNLRDGVLRAP